MSGSGSPGCVSIDPLSISSQYEAWCWVGQVPRALVRGLLTFANFWVTMNDMRLWSEGTSDEGTKVP